MGLLVTMDEKSPNNFTGDILICQIQAWTKDHHPWGPNHKSYAEARRNNKTFSATQIFYHEN